jgi:hypothetical protein
MKFILFLMFSIVLGSCAMVNHENVSYHDELEKCRVDAATWDTAMFALDLSFNQSRVTAPMTVGTYPTPDYNSLKKNSFHGVGTYYNDFDWNNSHILHSTFYYKSKDNNETKENPFFTIVSICDVIDTVEYSHVQNEIISRNHPDYIGQGRMKCMDQNIDYMAFHTKNKDQYAIVNMRLFNLSNGNLIFIKPMPDGSFRSMQLNPAFHSLDDIDTFLNPTKLSQDVLLFLNSSL